MTRSYLLSSKLSKLSKVNMNYFCNKEKNPRQKIMPTIVKIEDKSTGTNIQMHF